MQYGKHDDILSGCCFLDDKLYTYHHFSFRIITINVALLERSESRSLIDYEANSHTNVTINIIYNSSQQRIN